MLVLNKTNRSHLELTNALNKPPTLLTSPSSTSLRVLLSLTFFLFVLSRPIIHKYSFINSNLLPQALTHTLFHFVRDFDLYSFKKKYFSELKIQYNKIKYNKIKYSTIQYNTIQYNTIQYNTIQYNTIQYNTIQYNTIQYNTIQ